MLESKAFKQTGSFKEGNWLTTHIKVFMSGLKNPRNNSMTTKAPMQSWFCLHDYMLCAVFLCYWNTGSKVFSMFFFLFYCFETLGLLHDYSLLRNSYIFLKYTTHFFEILQQGSLGINKNVLVWGSNVSISCFCVLLFYKKGFLTR